MRSFADGRKTIFKECKQAEACENNYMQVGHINTSMLDFEMNSVIRKINKQKNKQMVHFQDIFTQEMQSRHTSQLKWNNRLLRLLA